jgi:phage tail sheath protein FI
MADLKTPGVYVTEFPAFPPSLVGVATAVPIFIGYTEFATDQRGEPLYQQPVPIASMTEFVQVFGGAAPLAWQVVETDDPNPDFHAAAADPATGKVTMHGYDVVLVAPSAGAPDQFNLYWQMRLYFANGGGACQIVSVGSYATAGSIVAADLLKGLDVAGRRLGPTLLVVPEACQLDAADYASVTNAMLAQAGTLQDRIAILDLPGGLTATTVEALTACQEALWTAVAPQVANASYGCSYGPALVTTLIDQSDFLFTALAGADNATINAILTTNANAAYEGQATQRAVLQSAIAAAFPVTGAPATNGTIYSNDASAYPPLADPSGAALKAWQLRLDNLLVNALPSYEEIKFEVVTRLAVQPPSGVIAGAIVASDARTGVWAAPANIPLFGVTQPVCLVTDSDQAWFNMPINGMATNILRNFTGRGTLIWGARTLDGNSNDYRYIQVRRTLIYIEQSVKQALQAYVFEPNSGPTWASVTASVSNFLTQLWQQGGLMGAKASDAFTVQCGLGSTMTGQNILDGQMIVAITLQMIHPAEFIELTFRQEMQGG